MVSKEIMENIDLEEGKIRVGGKWLTEDEIRYAIKMKVSSDDYNVADLAVALQTLINEMRKSAILRVRVPKDVAQELEDLSRERGESMESTLRNVLVEYITRKRELAEGIEEEPIGYEDMDTIKQEKEAEEEMESDESLSSDRREDANISIGDEDVEESEEELLDIDTTSKDSEIVEVEPEELTEVEDFDEEINESEVDALDSKKTDTDEGLEVEELSDMEDIDEDLIGAEIEDIDSEIELTDEELAAELMSEIESADNELKEARVRNIPRKKRAKKKKLIIRKKKLKNNA